MKMLEYERIDISEVINVNKTNLWKECDICHCWCFKDIGFKFEPYLCNGCHNLMQKAMGFNNIAVAYVVYGSAYIWNMEVLAELIFGIWVKMMQLT